MAKTTARRTAAALCAWLTACDYTKPRDEFVADADAVTIAAVLISGQSDAYLLATHPHRKPESGRPAPRVAATLSGPGWTASFDEDVPLARCNVQIPERWSPAVCLRAALPEPIRERTRYELAGTTDGGAFKGATTVPRPPIVHAPADTVRIDLAHEELPAELDVRFETPPEVSAITLDATNAFQLTNDGSPKPGFVIGFDPAALDVRVQSQRVETWTRWRSPGIRFDVQLLGFEVNYGRFLDYAGNRLLLEPWPDFGLDGDDGVYGYFGAGALSKGGIPVVVHVRSPSRARGPRAPGSRRVAAGFGFSGPPRPSAPLRKVQGGAFSPRPWGAGPLHHRQNQGEET